MPNSITRAILAAVLASWSGGALSSAPTTAVESLPNGLQVAVIYFPGSTNASLFTFLPYGLASDGPEQTQWSHLLEHLVLRSTVPTTAPWANAETLPDQMRLDFYGNIRNWREGLSHHRRWLQGEPFTESTLAAEKLRVLQEGDFAVGNLATHKFAMAAWNQAVRHGRDEVALRGDVQRANRAELQRQRDMRLVIPDQTTVCLAGGIKPEDAIPTMVQALAGIRSDAQSAPSHQPRPGRVEVHWDLDARHLVLCWPAPDPTEAEHAALLVAAQWLNMRFFGDPVLKERTGMNLAGADLRMPEGFYFYVSSSIRPGADFEDVRTRIQFHLDALRERPEDLAMAGSIGAQLAFRFAGVTDPSLIKSNAQRGMSEAMVEGNLAIQWASLVQRYGSHRDSLARSLMSVTSAAVVQAAIRHLSERSGSICLLMPAPDRKPFAKPGLAQ